ncbi:MAG: S41 family peptidase, partial [Actinomycetota bacterium]
TTPPPEATSTAIAPTTTPTTSVPPTVPSGYTLSDCDTPPVPFAVLCDVHELLEENHVDSPLDPSTLAAGAALGVEGYEGTGGGDAGTFVCAIPDPAFESVCQALERRTGGDPEAIEAAVEEGVAAMISLSLDPFTYYIPPELSGALTEDGIVGAVGLLITIRDPAGSVCTLVEDPCRLEVDMALVEGPAFQAGLRAGDVILSVDGESVQGSALVDVAGMLDGPEGSEVTVEVADGGGDSTAVVIDRAPAAVPELEAELPRPDVGYIRLPDFGMDVPAFLHTVLETWTQQGISHLVVDLRNNPGGFVDVATLVASEFLADGLVLRSESPSERLEYPVQEGGVASSGPAVTVVVNSGSASASEIVAAVLQERDRATIAGEPTFGKNTVQIGFPLRNDGELRVTVARWVTPDGASVAGDGLAPDVAMEIPPDATPAEIVDLVLG